jgi:hypothetical protein
MRDVNLYPGETKEVGTGVAWEPSHKEGYQFAMIV